MGVGRMAYSVDLNSDVGESFGAYKIGRDEKVLPFVTSANIACGYHAGDHNVMRRTVALAIAQGVGLGAHPGLPDLIGFGRRPMQIAAGDVYNSVLYQVGALQAFATVQQTPLHHVKPHGALYHTAATDTEIAAAIAQAVYDFNRELILFALSGSALAKAGTDVGLTVAEEVFADRTYLPDGTLTPRTHPHALIRDADTALQQVVRIVKEGTVHAVDGTIIPIQADTVCVHGDHPSAVQFVKKLRHALAAHDIAVKRVGR